VWPGACILGDPLLWGLIKRAALLARCSLLAPAAMLRSEKLEAAVAAVLPNAFLIAAAPSSATARTLDAPRRRPAIAA
jgi:hypothetical protein